MGGSEVINRLTLYCHESDVDAIQAFAESRAELDVLGCEMGEFISRSKISEYGCTGHMLKYDDSNYPDCLDLLVEKYPTVPWVAWWRPDGEDPEVEFYTGTGCEIQSHMAARNTPFPRIVLDNPDRDFERLQQAQDFRARLCQVFIEIGLPGMIPQALREELGVTPLEE